MAGDTKSNADLGRGGIGPRGRSKAPPYKPPRRQADSGKGRSGGSNTRTSPKGGMRANTSPKGQPSAPRRSAAQASTRPLRNSTATRSSGPSRQQAADNRRATQALARQEQAKARRAKNIAIVQSLKRGRSIFSVIADAPKKKLPVPKIVGGKIAAGTTGGLVKNIPLARTFSGKDDKAFKSLGKVLSTAATGTDKGSIDPIKRAKKKATKQLVDETVFGKSKAPKRVPELGPEGATRKGNIVTGNISAGPVAKDQRRRSNTQPFMSRNGYTISGGFPTSSRGEAEKSGTDVGATWAMDKLTRPLHAEAGAINATLKGKSPGKVLSEYGKGWSGKQKTVFSDVLKTAGVNNKLVRGGAGLTMDILLDPVTYLTFGRSTPARVGATKATKAFIKDVEGTGYKLSEADIARARKLGRDGKLPNQANKPTNKGVGVGLNFFGKRTPLVGVKTTSRAARVGGKRSISKTATRVREGRVPQGIFEGFAPDAKPAGVDEATHTTERRAGRQRRAETNAEQRRARRVAMAVKREAPKAEDQLAIINAIETGTIMDLPTKLIGVANQVEGEFQRIAAREGDVGKLTSTRPGYVYHMLAPKGVKAEEKARRKAQRAERRGGISQNDSAKQRVREGTLAEKIEQYPGIYETDLPTILNTRGRKSASVVADEKYRVALKDAGRPVVKEGKPVDLKGLSPDDAVYAITREGGVKKVYPVTGGSRTKITEDIAKAPDDYRILPAPVGDKVAEALQPRARSAPAQAFDRYQATAKFLLTQPNPAYHARNLYGDAYNAYRGGTSVKDYRQAISGVRRINAKERAETQINGKVKDSLRDGGIEINGKTRSWDSILQGAIDNSAMRSGFSVADLEESAKFGRAGQRLNRYSQNREDVARLGMFISGLKKGLTDAEAADGVGRFLYDYGDLTPFERNVARRIFTFYTFPARNTRSLAGTLVTRPGKIANVQKVREEAQRASPLPENYEDYLKDYERRGQPFPNPFYGQNDIVDKWIGPAVYPGLPTTDLNRLTIPFVSGPPLEVVGAQVGQLIQSADILVKNIIELSMPKGGYSSFFGDVIEDPKEPLVPAPNKFADALGKLGPPGEALRKKLGMTKYQDKRTGKMIWGWPGKVDYVARSLPETNTLASVLTDVKNSRGITRQQRLTAWLTGMRSGEYNPAQRALDKAYEDRDKLDTLQSRLKQKNGGKAPRIKSGPLKGKYTKEYWERKKKIEALTDVIEAAKKKRGDVMPDEDLPTGEDANPNRVGPAPSKAKPKNPPGSLDVTPDSGGDGGINLEPPAKSGGGGFNSGMSMLASVLAFGKGKKSAKGAGPIAQRLGKNPADKDQSIFKAIEKRAPLDKSDPRSNVPVFGPWVGARKTKSRASIADMYSNQQLARKRRSRVANDGNAGRDDGRVIPFPESTKRRVDNAPRDGRMPREDQQKGLGGRNPVKPGFKGATATSPLALLSGLFGDEDANATQAGPRVKLLAAKASSAPPPPGTISSWRDANQGTGLARKERLFKNARRPNALAAGGDKQLIASGLPLPGEKAPRTPKGMGGKTGRDKLRDLRTQVKSPEFKKLPKDSQRLRLKVLKTLEADAKKAKGKGPDAQVARKLLNMTPAEQAKVFKAVKGKGKGSSDPYIAKIERAAKKEGIRPELLYGVWGAENNFSKGESGDGSENGAGAAGPFQFIRSTADQYGVKNRGNFDESVKGAAKYLGTLQREYGNERDALAAYNSGKPWAVSGSYPETANYVPKVLDIGKKYPGSKGGKTIYKVLGIKPPKELSLPAGTPGGGGGSSSGSGSGYSGSGSSSSGGGHSSGGSGAVAGGGSELDAALAGAGAGAGASDNSRQLAVLAGLLNKRNPNNMLQRFGLLTPSSSASSASSTSALPAGIGGPDLPRSRKRRTSTYGNDPVTGYRDSQDNNRTSSGISNNRPGIATMDKGTLRGWYVYRAAAGKYKGKLLGVQRIETGPGAIRDGVDKNATLVRLTGLKQGNSYPTGLAEDFAYIGKKPPKGRQIAPGLYLLNG